MRKVFGVVFAMLLLMGSTFSAMAAEKATPAADDKAATSGDTNPVNPQIGDPVTLFAANGDAIATVTVTDVERNWEGYDEY